MANRFLKYGKETEWPEPSRRVFARLSQVEPSDEGGPILFLEAIDQNWALDRPEALSRGFPALEGAALTVIEAKSAAIGGLLISHEADGDWEDDSAWLSLELDESPVGEPVLQHIPNAVGYQEKQYFSPGDTGFKVWKTCYANVGVGICWDQWFPEAARCMALQGAELLMYPTAIGSEPAHPESDSSRHWQNAMCGHAAANIIPVIASNRIGLERAKHNDSLEMTFYGSSFIADAAGVKVKEANRTEEAVLVPRFDLDQIGWLRSIWGIFRDRRPELYGATGTLDGQVGPE